MVRFFFLGIVLVVFFYFFNRWANRELARRRQKEAKSKESAIIHITIETVKKEP